MATSAAPTSAAPTSQPGAVRDHGFHSLRIRRVVRETAEAASFVLDVPADLRAAFGYEAGQFLTFRVRLDGEVHHRCYSMSSSPSVDDELQVTVKRVPGGLVSNWMIDSLAPGDVVDASVPAGVFRLAPGDGELVAFSAGSGITPVFSLLKSALATTSRRARLYYANRDREAVIFGAELDGLADRHHDRFEVVHHLDVERGFVDAGARRRLRRGPARRRVLRLRAHAVHGHRRGGAAGARRRRRPHPHRAVHAGRAGRAPPSRGRSPAPTPGRPRPGSRSSSAGGPTPSTTARARRSCRPPGRWGWRPRSRASRARARRAWPSSSRGR